MNGGNVMPKSSRCFIAILFVFTLIITLSNAVYAGDGIVFEKDFTISKWHLHVSQHTFSADDSGEGIFKISKNDPQKEIRRGFIILNGSFTFLRDFLIGDEIVFEKRCALKTTNRLFVFLIGKPGASASMQIKRGEDKRPAPKITAFTAEPSKIKRGGSSTLSWQTENADSCEIRPQIGTVDPSGSAIVLPAETTTYTLTATGTGDPATSKVTVIIENSSPVAEQQVVATDEDTAVEITLTGTDLDDDSLIYTVTGQPGQGTLSGTPPALTYTPNENYNGSDSFFFKANDGQTDSNTATVKLNINPVNDVPVAQAGTDQTVFVGETVALDGSASADVDGDSLSFSWAFIDVPAGSTAVLSDGSVEDPTFTPDFTGTYEVQLIVNDGKVDSPADQVVISANPKMVNVPEVVGMTRSDADAALKSVGLVVGTITTEHSGTVPEGSVIRQNPIGGSSVIQNTAVDLIISLGPENQPPALSFAGSPYSISQGEFAYITWSIVRAESAHIDNGIGPVLQVEDGWTIVSPAHTTTYTLTATGPGGSANGRVTIEVTGSPEPQPEGSFGKTYEDLIPSDSTVEMYDPKRFALITGKVQNLAGSPIVDVSITIHGYPEYGTVSTDSGGQFTIPVEGGETLTVVYQKDGLIPGQRKVYVPWNDIAIAETIRMIVEDSASTTITFDGDPNSVVTHQSATVADEFGNRSASMVFTGDNRAYLVDENGEDVMELTTISTRATEYSTFESMPARLPPNSAYTYCVELSVDGAQRVRFEKPVTLWVNNFLGFDVGIIAPVGSYDRDRGVWVPEKNGLVVKLLDTDSDNIVRRCTKVSGRGYLLEGASRAFYPS
jgi:hypothetical protein